MGIGFWVVLVSYKPKVFYHDKELNYIIINKEFNYFQKLFKLISQGN